MLLSYNTKKVIDTMGYVERLNNIDKVRFTIHILENLDFKTKYDVKSLIETMKKVLAKLDPDSIKTITNFAKYENLLLLSSKYMEFHFDEKKKFSIELLFDIYETDFQDNYINKLMNDSLDIYNYAYQVNASVE